MAARIAAHDWSRHPLGGPASWPVELKTALSIMLGTRFALCVRGGGGAAAVLQRPLHPAPRRQGRGRAGRADRERLVGDPAVAR
jgi:hypothetical protein